MNDATPNAAPKTEPVATVPAAALAVMQDEVALQKEQLANKDEQLKLADEAANLARDQIAAQAALIKALEEKKLAAEIRAESLTKDANLSHASSKERHIIVVDEGRDKGDYKRVPVGCNGRSYDLARGVKIEVPQDVISVLNDAVVGAARPILDERTGVEAGVEFVNTRRFPFTYVGKSIDETGKRLLNPDGTALALAA